MCWFMKQPWCEMVLARKHGHSTNMQAAEVAKEAES